MIQDADAVVVGGGVHGASAAYHPAKAGKQVALVEKWTVGSGSSGASGGIIRCHYSNESMVRLAHRAAQRWPELETELGQPVDYVQNGLLVAVTAPDADNMLDVGGIHRWVPEFNLSGLALATYEAEAGYADPYSAAVAFASKAREVGAQIYTKTTVRGIEGNGTGVRQVLTDRGSIRTPLIMSCSRRRSTTT